MTIGKEGSYQAQPRFWGPVLVQELLHDAHWDQESLCSVLNVKSHTSGVHGYGLAALLWRVAVLLSTQSFAHSNAKNAI